MKILVAPLNWGLGHATRCIPLIRRFVSEGHEVVLGGDGMSLELLRKHFPDLPFRCLPALHIHYSASDSQTISLFMQLPKLAAFCLADYRCLKKLLHQEHFDRIISDNRFCFYNKQAYCIYMTHQLTIKLPQRLKWAEPLARKIHYRIIRKYDRCWVPDRKETGLGGELSHPKRLPENAEYIGILSRFDNPLLPHEALQEDMTLAILSGPEPQRTLFEMEIIKRYRNNGERLLLVEGKIQSGTRPTVTVPAPNISVTESLDDKELCVKMLAAKKIIARSGYSTIMDLAFLDLLHKAELIPTPGQTEQEYLANYLKSRF